jgi:ATP-dependent Clp protease adaptor protein ClpS
MTAEAQTTSKIELEEPKPWVVLLHNDDFTPMDFVVELLQHVFGKGIDEAVGLMLTVHQSGNAVVGRYTKEVAIAKATTSVELAERAGHPLLATAEPTA